MLTIVILSTVLLSVVFDTLVSVNSSGTIEGFITDVAGSPIEGAKVSVGNSNATTDSSGEYSVKVSIDLLKNPFEMNVSAQGYKTKDFQVQPNASDTLYNATLEKEFEDSTVDGNVTDAESLPISGAGINIGNYSTTTDLNGSYTITLPSGSYYLAASANGYEPFTSPLDLNQQETTDDIVLQRSMPVEVNYQNATYPLDSDSNIWDSTQIAVDGHPSEADTILFLVRGITNTSYLRDSVAETYENGTWLLASDPEILDYSGGSISRDVTNYTAAYEMNFEIQPLSVFGGFIPSVKNVDWLSLNFSIQYYLEQQIFFSEYTFTNSYNVSYASYQFDEATLKEVEVNSDSRYLGVPSELLQKLQPLAMSITQNITSPYDQAVAIEDFLRRNYSYDINYTQAPAGVDPVEWFLFDSKAGVCTNFNSAFVLLARSIGLPARLCTGYLIDGTKDYQAVEVRQRHAYAEVLFKDIGWITFDATGTGSGSSESPSEGPVFKIVYPTQGSYVSGSRITIEGVASGFYKDARFSVSDPRFSLTYWNSGDVGDFAFDNNTYIPDGTYSVTIGIADAAGNTGSDTVTFTVGNVPTQVPTQISITNCSRIGIKGSTFIVEGQVVDSSGRGVDNMNVLIYITASKNESGRLCGQGKTQDGFFNITCPVSKDIQVGNYLIIAHAIGNSQYQDSWSDPPISIMAETSLAVTSPSKVIMGRTFSVGGMLNEKLTNQPLANETLFIAIGDQNYSLLTNDQGLFNV
ncbi:MAG TPA: transglutaminase domain-containing protein, partial [Candidatus Acidoferrum sp.]|nr:transglutaminase domain-containing protein [Candidatus Acidoferrum sp.]